jgi:hypothetical protein
LLFSVQDGGDLNLITSYNVRGDVGGSWDNQLARPILHDRAKLLKRVEASLILSATLRAAAGLSCAM